MTENPYQSSPIDQTDQVKVPPASIGYRGGWWGVLGIGIGMGLLFPVLGFLFSLPRRFVNAELGVLFIFGAPALLWVLSLFFLNGLLRPIQEVKPIRYLALFLLSVLGYVLYVPACVTTSMVVDNAMIGEPVPYSVKELSIVVGSVFSFVVVLTPIAVWLLFLHRKSLNKQVVNADYSASDSEKPISRNSMG